MRVIIFKDDLFYRRGLGAETGSFKQTAWFWCRIGKKNKGELSSSPLFNLNTQNYEKLLRQFSFITSE